MNSVDLFEPSLMDFDDFDKELEWVSVHTPLCHAVSLLREVHARLRESEREREV